MKPFGAKIGKVDFCFEMGFQHPGCLTVLKTCGQTIADLEKNYRNRSFSTKTFPHFQQISVLKSCFEKILA